MIKKAWSWLADHWPWWLKWMGPGSDDDLRNFGWHIGEHLRVDVLWAWTILDMRIGNTDSCGDWRLLDVHLPHPTRQNFYNAVFSAQVYLVRYKFKAEWALILSAVALVLCVVGMWLPWFTYCALFPLASCFVWPKLLIVFRPTRKHYSLLATEAPLFDRGERHLKFTPWYAVESGEPDGWEEGSV